MESGEEILTMILPRWHGEYCCVANLWSTVRVKDLTKLLMMSRTASDLWCLMGSRAKDEKVRSILLVEIGKKKMVDLYRLWKMC